MDDLTPGFLDYHDDQIFHQRAARLLDHIKVRVSDCPANVLLCHEAMRAVEHHSVRILDFHRDLVVDYRDDRNVDYHDDYVLDYGDDRILDCLDGRLLDDDDFWLLDFNGVPVMDYRYGLARDRHDYRGVD